MTDLKTVIFASYDQWLAANPLYKWRMNQETPVTMRAAASQIGVSQTSIMLWEDGSVLPKHKHMQRIASTLTLHVSALHDQWQTWLDSKPVDSAQPTIQVA